MNDSSGTRVWFDEATGAYQQGLETGAAAERARILAAVQEASFTLCWPATPSTCSITASPRQAWEVVPLEALVALLGDAE